MHPGGGGGAWLEVGAKVRRVELFWTRWGRNGLGVLDGAWWARLVVRSIQVSKQGFGITWGLCREDEGHQLRQSVRKG